MKIPERFRKVGIDWTCSLMNWNSERVIHPARDNSFRFWLGWKIDDLLCRMFGFFYLGSRAEVEDGIEHARDGVDLKYLTPVQQEISLRFVEWE